MKKFKRFLTYGASFLLLNLVCKTLTDDICLTHLLEPAPKSSKWALPTKPENLSSLLSQKYTYLGKGKQAYVFVSEDEKHVLKLFKPMPPSFPLSFFGKTYKIGFSKVPLAKKLFSMLHEKEEMSSQNLAFQSYFNGFFKLPEETLIEYLHLTYTSDLQTTFELYDKIGARHFLKADSCCFMIQKKADLLYPKLEKLILAQKTEEAKQILEQFVDLALRFVEEGVVNPSTISANLGCFGTRPVQIDAGRLLQKKDLIPSLSDAENRVSLDQVYFSTRHMKKWLEKTDPALRLYLEEVEKEKLQKWRSR